MDISQVTYMNAGLLAKGLKALGNKGYSVRDIDGLGDAGGGNDRRTFWDTGTAIIIPAPFSGPWKNYNVNVEFGLAFNTLEGEDNDDWLDFNTTPTPNSNYLQSVVELFFFNYTVRNNLIDAPAGAGTIRLYVMQNPFWVSQLNKLLKDIVR